ncbi:hypothetical protein NPIL_320901 [Nephila pilipes]|uniref:Uncharacterized protein n=1 Tax=Nephila pilipes TaxID=299642 RepID=A0A8X6QT35_NEPPI|nr:hypothetical protein NPIL_320901 [Nephila pilipes]
MSTLNAQHSVLQNDIAELCDNGFLISYKFLVHQAIPVEKRNQSCLDSGLLRAALLGSTGKPISSIPLLAALTPDRIKINCCHLLDIYWPHDRYWPHKSMKSPAVFMGIFFCSSVKECDINCEHILHLSKYCLILILTLSLLIPNFSCIHLRYMIRANNSISCTYCITCTTVGTVCEFAFIGTTQCTRIC